MADSPPESALATQPRKGPDSPKRNANGARNPFYETIREVFPGDVVLAFVDAFISGIGVAGSKMLSQGTQDMGH